MNKYKLNKNLYPFRIGDVFVKVSETEYALDKGSFRIKLEADLVEKDKYLFTKIN